MTQKEIRIQRREGLLGDVAAWCGDLRKAKRRVLRETGRLLKTYMHDNGSTLSTLVSYA